LNDRKPRRYFHRNRDTTARNNNYVTGTGITEIEPMRRGFDARTVVAATSFAKGPIGLT